VELASGALLLSPHALSVASRNIAGRMRLPDKPRERLVSSLSPARRQFARAHAGCLQRNIDLITLVNICMARNGFSMIDGTYARGVKDEITAAVPAHSLLTVAVS
jgi:hypothetical protein